MVRDLRERMERLIVEERLPAAGRASRLAGRTPEHDLLELGSLVGRMERRAAEGIGLAETDRAFRATQVDMPQDLEVTCRQHPGGPDAVRSGDSGRAESAMRNHFGTIRARAGPKQQFSTNSGPN
ncbi:hypothetical protein [Streptomyces cavernae]|uniref:hypothetical protein n=1 Tax=Streptomyces cavernae TaxID=2259034 RepID=UPI00192E33E7|nr:hypothetical protein [Streptomyces cavernae]